MDVSGPRRRPLVLTLVVDVLVLVHFPVHVRVRVRVYVRVQLGVHLGCQSRASLGQEQLLLLLMGHVVLVRQAIFVPIGRRAVSRGAGSLPIGHRRGPLDGRQGGGRRGSGGGARAF
jgi:hypothetical protein